MGIDKFKAKHEMWRISEKFIFIINYIGGTFGCILGMNVFHHKTKKIYFHVNFYIAAAMHVLIILLLIFKF